MRQQRIYTRLNGAPEGNLDRERAAEAYKASKRALKKEIKTEKRNSWCKLCEELNEDIWGKGYRIVMGKINTTPSLSLTKEQEAEVLKELFPTHFRILWPRVTVPEKDIPYFGEEEVIDAVKRIKLKKAPGPDNLPPEVVKAVANRNGTAVQKIMNGCLRRAEFPTDWKTARLILIEKPRGDGANTTTYRPICLIDVAGKLLETLIKNRLEKTINERNLLSDHQYEFRAGRSTMDAVKRVLNIQQATKRKAYKNRSVCAMITFDVENAFNAAPWPLIVQAMEEDGYDEYLIRMIQAYLSDRRLITPNGVYMQMTAGFPQGSVLGPILWNILYDIVLRTEMGDGVTLVAYADDLALVVEAKMPTILEARAQAACSTVKTAMEDIGVNLAPKKTEMVLLAGARRIGQLRVNIEDMLVANRKEVKYMGIHIGENAKTTL